MRLSLCFVLSILAATSTGLLRNASAQEITIETSANQQDNRFFGEGVLQVVIADLKTDNDNTVDEFRVEINAKPQSGPSSFESFQVPETSDSSGRFEFFLVHADAITVGPEDMDPINSAGVEGDGICLADCAPFISFGPGGDLDIQSDLYEEVTFEIRAGSLDTEVSYEETPSELRLDRDSYGTNNYVYISVEDQDANLNPFVIDEFTVDPHNGPNDDLLDLDGGTFGDTVTFRETGDNTAIFEGRYRLGVSINVDSESLVLTLFDKANYRAMLSSPENNSNNIDGISFTVGNSDGTMEIGAGTPQREPTWDPVIISDKESYAMGESVRITIRDQDANINSTVADSVKTQVLSGNSHIEISALETGTNSGIFEAIFQLREDTDVGSGAISPGESATITYKDERPSDYFEKVEAGENPEKDFAIEIDVQLPVKTGVDATNLTEPIIEGKTGESGTFAVGTSVTISTTIANNNDLRQPFVVLIEVRDNNDVTIFLALQSAILDPSGSKDIGVLWQPEQAGAFEVRTFAITNVNGEAELLSSPVISKFIVV